MRSVRQTVERRFESYSGSRFFGDESRVCCGCGAGSPSRPSLFTSLLVFTDVGIWGYAFPRRRSPITESTREVLFLFDWCFCAWLPPSLYLRDPRASLGDCEDRSRSRPLRRKWSGASPRPPSGGSPLAGTTPLLVFTDVGIWGYACYDCCMLSSPAFVCMHAAL